MTRVGSPVSSGGSQPGSVNGLVLFGASAVVGALASVSLFRTETPAASESVRKEETMRDRLTENTRADDPSPVLRNGLLESW